MAHPLELSYRWQPPALFASLGAVALLSSVLHGREPGWPAVVALVLGLWAVGVGLIWARTRAYLMVDGTRLTIRRVRRLHTIDGEQLVRVQQLTSPVGPGYALVVRDPDGQESRHVAPVSLLRSGRATLFEWILVRAPQAELDRGATQTLDRLRTEGLIG